MNDGLTPSERGGYVRATGRQVKSHRGCLGQGSHPQQDIVRRDKGGPGRIVEIET